MTLKFSFPEIPFRSTITMAYGVSSPLNPVTNSVRGDRALVFRQSALSTFLRVKYDLGVGNTESIDHFIIARCDYHADEGATALLMLASNDDISYPTVATVPIPFTYSDLRSQDVIYDLGGTSTAYRWWFVYGNSAGTGYYPTSKFYFGQYFELGENPTSWRMQIDEKLTEPFETDNGYQIAKQGKYPRRKWAAQWSGITNAKAEEFEAKCAIHLQDNSAVSLFMYDDSGLNEFFGAALQHVWLHDLEIERVQDDYNLITCNITEQLG